MSLPNGASQHANVLTLTMTMYHFGFMLILTMLWTTSRLRIMLQFVCFVIGAIFGGCFAATVMALIFAHTDLYVKDDDNNNEEESLQESER